MGKRPVTSAPTRGTSHSPIQISQTEYSHRLSTPYSDGLMLCGNVSKERIFVQDTELDEETLRTRKYWRRWGRQAARDILNEAHREQAAEIRRQNQPQLIITARCQTPPSDLSSSTESLNTKISLFNTASVTHNEPAENSYHRRNAMPKHNWEKFAQKRRGLLFEMMSRDAEQLQCIVKGDRRNAHDDLDEVMTAEERDLVHSCAFQRGIKGRSKSNSTANVLSFIPKPQTVPKISKRKPKKGRDRTPSPSRIAQALPEDRPESAAASFAKNLHQRMAPHGLSRSITQSSIISSVKSPQKSMRSTQLGMPDIEGALSKRIKSKLNHTYTALERITGVGDPRSTITQTMDEKGRYTDADYARYPRYPQNIRICPQLSQVIREDTQQRMGRPRQQKLKERDLRLHEQDANNSLGRSQRNLIIFNWLNSIDEGNYDICKVPDIVDLEGDMDRTGKVYPQVYTEYTMAPEDYSRLASRGSLKTAGDCGSEEHYGSEGSEAFTVSSTCSDSEV